MLPSSGISPWKGMPMRLAILCSRPGTWRSWCRACSTRKVQAWSTRNTLQEELGWHHTPGWCYPQGSLTHAHTCSEQMLPFPGDGVIANLLLVTMSHTGALQEQLSCSNLHSGFALESLWCISEHFHENEEQIKNRHSVNELIPCKSQEHKCLPFLPLRTLLQQPDIIALTRKTIHCFEILLEDLVGHRVCDIYCHL